MVAESMGLPFVYVRPEPKNMADKIKWRVFCKRTKCSCSRRFN
jgi:hypothetical protein